jgi:hypothetical protein
MALWPLLRRAKPAWIAGAAALLVLLAACAAPAAGEMTPSPAAGQGTGEGPAAGASPAAGETLPSQPAPDKPLTPEELRTVWQATGHANTFVVAEDGTNNPCARCHSPVNWTPSMDDMPESCYACKFEIDPPPPFVAEEEWVHVECKVCHREKKGNVEPEVAWLEIPQIGEYREVAGPNEVCLQCHQTVEVDGHPGPQLAGAHANMACLDCHDGHSLQAGCSTSGCHPALDGTPPEIPGHDADHASVTCAACHADGEPTVGPDEAGQWVTWAAAAKPGQDAAAAYTAHNTVKPAPCERGHFTDNPWQLSVQTAAAAP